MALLVTTENRPIFLDSKVANLLWLVKTGERKGTPEARAKILTIDKWYLNRETAPSSYLRQNPKVDEKRSRGKTVLQTRLPYKDS